MSDNTVLETISDALQKKNLEIRSLNLQLEWLRDAVLRANNGDVFLTIRDFIKSGAVANDKVSVCKIYRALSGENLAKCVAWYNANHNAL